MCEISARVRLQQPKTEEKNYGETMVKHWSVNLTDGNPKAYVGDHFLAGWGLPLPLKKRHGSHGTEIGQAAYFNARGPNFMPGGRFLCRVLPSIKILMPGRT